MTSIIAGTVAACFVLTSAINYMLMIYAVLISMHAFIIDVDAIGWLWAICS